MPIHFLEYKLEGGVQGFIHNWLIAGPQAVPVVNTEQLDPGQRKLAIAHHYYVGELEIAQMPADRAPLHIAGNGPIGDAELEWRYWRCLVDHFVDLSTFHHTWHYLRTWAYTQVLSPDALDTVMILTTNGPADVWINGQHIHRQEHFCHQCPQSVVFSASLRDGPNDVMVRFEEVAARECPYVMALQITGIDTRTAEKISIRVPTDIPRPDRYQLFERLFDQAYIEQNVVHMGNNVLLRWADDLDAEANLYYHIQDEAGRVYLEGGAEPLPSKQVDVGHPARLWERGYYAALRPTPREYYETNTRYQKRIPFHVLDTAYSEQPYGAYEERRQEALENVAKRENNLFAEIARMALGRWEQLNQTVILDAIARINQRGDCSDFDLVGLLGVSYRYANRSSFPEIIKQHLKECILNFKYWHDEPGTDAMCYTTENHSILFHTCQVLAGQLYPDEIFTNTGLTGHWHRDKGERLAIEWLRTRGTGGFLEWDSNCYFDEDLLALSHLVDLAENDEVRELAAIVMDKMLFTMAINSYKGVFGSTHGRTYAPMIKGGQLEATSGIGRLMWGMGVWNHHVRGLVAMACSGYELPFIIADIASSLPEEFWSRERHVGELEAWKASGSLGPEINKVTYKTPDYMLCSAQDYHPGEKGYQQHIWQATLGPNAVVFVNHPPCASEEGAHRPNFWHGNVILPRVVQWKDVLIAIHNLPEDDWLGFTHAYFPTRAFDQYAIRKQWAFACKGNGYLAITAGQGIELIKRGPSAYYELRSYGEHNVWLCHMGRRSLDGGFVEFQEKILKMDVSFQELAINCTTLRSNALTFGWEAPLTVNGQEQPITGFKHYENTYCTADLPAADMEVHFDEYLLKWHFA